jgi:hypothetical protein
MRRIMTGAAAQHSSQTPQQRCPTKAAPRHYASPNRLLRAMT